MHLCFNFIVMYSPLFVVFSRIISYLIKLKRFKGLILAKKVMKQKTVSLARDNFKPYGFGKHSLII